MPLDVENELAKLLTMEIEMHRKTEPFKQELRVAKDFSEDSCIACLDSWGYGFVDPKNIKLFFK